ncbi:MAG: response regulator, partial [Cyanobacteria bacterium REEB65]|nr:response regulator [Cyanobacteria bacterium REEB65]
NLVDNAIKFTPPGGLVSVKAFLRDGKLVTEVRDNGIGIAQQDVPKLFERFTQLDMSTTRQTAGTGLGLSICKAIVEAHHGQIGLESAPGKGSTFWFSLPVQIPSQQDLDVLVVDDAPENREVMVVILKALGHKVTEAIDGAQALRLCLDEKRHFDIVLMDILMPNVDGLEATRRLRDRPETRDLPIILVSAKTSVANQEAAKKSGADAFLQKPFKRRDLVEILTRTLLQAGE